MKIKPFTTILALSVLVWATTSISADESADIDNTVAAGIIFKTAYLLGAEGTWSDVENNSPKYFEDAMATIAEDLSRFSKSEHGRKLKLHGRELIDFITRGTLMTFETGYSNSANFLREHGLDPDKTGPVELAIMFEKRIEAYAKLSSTPAWVYDRSKREEGGTGKAPTDAELKSK